MQDTFSTFKIGDEELTLRISDAVFKPVSTTQKFVELVEIPESADVLDLGCGVGPLTIASVRKGARHVTAVDIVPEACKFCKENVERAGVADQVTVLCGDLYGPVAGQKFDVIVNDVSGIAEGAARISTWYPPEIPTGGEDGTDVIIRVLDEAPNYLNPGGLLYFATASLSNAVKIIDHAKKLYGDAVELLKSYRFPFSSELTANLDELEKLRLEGKVDFENKRSRLLWTLSVYRIAIG